MNFDNLALPFGIVNMSIQSHPWYISLVGLKLSKREEISREAFVQCALRLADIMASCRVGNLAIYDKDAQVFYKKSRNILSRNSR